MCRVVPIGPGVLEHGKPGPDVVEHGDHGLAVHIGREACNCPILLFDG